MRKPVAFLVTAAAAVLFTVYAVLDTFVIERVETVVEQGPSSHKMTPTPSPLISKEPTPAENTKAPVPASPTVIAGGDTPSGPLPSPEILPSPEPTKDPMRPLGGDPNEPGTIRKGENFYEDDNISIVLSSYREFDSDIYVADIRLAYPDYLRTAFAKSAYGHNVSEPVSETAESVGAILAVNGDFYGVQEDGFVLKNGVVYRKKVRDNQTDLYLFRDGSMSFCREDEIPAEYLPEIGVRDVLCFGPVLLENHEIKVTPWDEVALAMNSNPRTAVGQFEDELHYVFVVSDGRSDESVGLTLYELAQFMNGLGVKNAYNLDGGGSSTMVFDNRVVNHPANSHGIASDGSEIKERSVSDIVYIGY